MEAGPSYCGFGAPWPLVRIAAAQADEQSPLCGVETITRSADADRCGVVQEPIEDGGGDDRITEDRTPIPVILFEVGQSSRARSGR
jgi:hypothetical protein